MEQREVNERIQESEMLLIGIGSGFGGTPVDARTLNYEAGKAAYRDICENRQKEQIELYNQLFQKISGKNYFVIDTNIDGSIDLSDFDGKKVVSPCGSLRRVQCGCIGMEGIMDATEVYEKDITQCPLCGQPYLPNVHGVAHYNENGYLEQWGRYNRWLGLTLNKKLVILELGSDFLYASLLRWPFEKVTMLNQKALLIRVNEQFPQGIPEIKERILSVSMNPKEFVKSILL